MREANAEAYTPMLVSIGPLHVGNKHLDGMEKHKWRLLHDLLRRTSNDQGTTSSSSRSRRYNRGIQRLLDFMAELVERTMACYLNPLTELNVQNFCLMMILDGCFVVELLRLYNKASDDPLLATRWMRPVLQRDMIMLENQLPFFVLQKIYNLTKESDNEPTLTELALKFFNDLLPGSPQVLDKKINKKYEREHLHLLDLVRSSLLLPSMQTTRTRDSPFEDRKLVHCVSELQEAGVKLKKGDVSRDLPDIKFRKRKGVLEIPHLVIHDSTPTAFLNIMAFEQCRSHAYLRPHITNYVVFFDCLINSAKDVELLHYNGIIEHSLGSDEEVSTLFNKLCKGAVFAFNDSYLCEVLTDVNEYYNNTCNVWRAKLVHDYFSNPWALISLLGAVILLLLTIAQTFFSVYPYLKSKS